jgi:eukaryotic-like serine/threonine-protein kinase
LIHNQTTRFEEGVFAGALALPPAERTAFVQRACGGDVGLCARIEALLHGHELHDGALDSVPDGAAPEIGRTLQAEAAAISETAERIGRYHLQRKLGEGGFGVVWVAEQREPVRRQVALKIIRPGMDSREVIARFELERQALALMDHPNIARVFDGGATESGRPFFVMELVSGIPITRYCDEHELGTDARLQLFLEVCRAVQHAHQKGIIHRDLKPSNILVTEQDGVAVPKVIDFGIAKAASGRITDVTVQTVQAHVMGTPAYMSPEQMEIGRTDIDTRSDIYNLGVLLYELLTGQMPFEARKLSSGSFDELRRIIREEEPPKPSVRVSTLDYSTREIVARQRKADYAKLRSALRGDIDWIVMCCLEKERARRYDTANGLARDIERHINDEPVTARPPTAAYVLRKTMRRHRVAFTAGGAIAVSLVFAVVASRVEAKRAAEAENAALGDRRRAETARDEAEKHKRTADLEGARSAQVAQFMKNMLTGVGPQVARGRDTALLRAILDQEAARIRADASTQLEVTVDLLETLGLAYSAIGEHRLGEQLLWEALNRYEKQHGRKNLVIARLLYEIGALIELQGASYRHDAPLREALALREDLLPPKHIDLAQTRSELGGITAGSQPGEGKRLLLAALDVQREALGTQHPDLARTVGKLARANLGLNDAAEAEKLARESIEIYRRAIGPDTTESLASERTLALALSNQQRHTDAEQVLRVAIERCQRLLSPAHPMNGYLRLDLSKNLQGQHRLADAEAAAREALDLAQRYDLPGPAGQILQQVNGLMRPQKRYTEMEQITRRQIELTRPRADEYPLMLALHLQQLTGILRAQDRYAEAEISAREALALRTGPGADTKGWLTQSSRTTVGAILTKLGKFAEAEPLLISAYEGLIELDREIPTQTPDYFRATYVAFITLYQEWGRADERKKWNERAHAFVQVLRARGRPGNAKQLEAELENLSAGALPP